MYAHVQGVAKSNAQVTKSDSNIESLTLSLCYSLDHIESLTFSVSNGSNLLERFRVRVGTGTELLQRFYHMKTPDRCIWAGFHLKTLPLQAQIVRSNWVFEFWSYHDMINM